MIVMTIDDQMRYDICGGCYTYMKSVRHNLKHVCIPPYTDYTKCPCITCIIKGMCKNGCQKFRVFRGEEFENRW